MFILRGWLLVSALILPLDSYANEWELVKNRNEIKVYTRDVAEQKVKAFRAETTIRAQIVDVAALFSADHAYKDWLHSVVVSESVEQISSREQILYLVQKLPLVKDRDMVVLGVMSQDPTTKVLSVSVSEVPNLLPVNPSMVRIPRIRSSFTFTPVESGELHVVYTADVNPGGKIPTAIANAFAVRVPYKTLLNLRAMSSTLGKYRDPDIVYPFENAP